MVLKRIGLLIALLFYVVVAQAQGTCPSGLPVTGTHCYFIAASGSDMNNGTSELTPWKHAPYMSNCANNCSGLGTPAAGTGFVFRGGDDYHRFASTNTSSDTPLGGQWNWGASGNSLGTNCNYPTTTSSCIYLGVDTTWYNSAVCGASFCRPKFDMDNPTWANSTHQDGTNAGFITACTSDAKSSSTVNGLVGAEFNVQGIILDNWELLGLCWTQEGTPTAPNMPAIWEISSSANEYITVIHVYVHGWTEAYNPQTNGGSNNMDLVEPIGDSSTPSSSASFNVFAYNVFDGTDSCPYATAGYQSGGQPRCTLGPVRYGDAYIFHDNVIRYMSNGVSPSYNPSQVYNNLFEDIYESYDPSDHGAVFEAANPPNDCPPYNEFFYNNVTRNTNTGIVWEISTCGGQSSYISNNVFWNALNVANGIIIDGTQTSPSVPQVYFTNNTIDGNVNLFQLRFQGSNFTGDLTLENNHLIGGTGSAAYTLPLNSSSTLFNGTTTGTITDSGGEVSQTESAANTQGYNNSNNYAPPSGCTSVGTCATYHAGNNLSGTCSTLLNCNGSTGGVTNTSGSGAIPMLVIVSPNSRNTTFDAGAYQGPLGSGGTVTLSPSSKNFGNQAVFTTGLVVTFTLSNTTSSSVTGITISNSGGNTGDFLNVGGGTCGSTLSPSSSCTINYQFSPSAIGARSTTLTVSDSASSSPQTSALFGNGIAVTSTAPTAVFTKSMGQGNWQGRYGLDGYSIALGPQSLPSYASVSEMGALTWNWNNVDLRALSTSSGRLASCWYNNTPWYFDINLTDGKTHQVTAYVLDDDSTTRQETLAVTDTLGNVLDTRPISQFNAGMYLSWMMSGHVHLTVTHQAGANGVVSGLFFN